MTVFVYATLQSLLGDARERQSALHTFFAVNTRRWIKRAKCARVVTLVFIAFSAPMATAQNPFSPKGAERSPGCLPRASRAKESCDPKKTVVRTERELTFPVKLPAPKVAHCAATFDIAYTQRNTAVSVDGTIGNKDCGASSGDYKLAISIRDENGDLKIVEFMESWKRDDDRPVKFSGTYPIGTNADLLRVRPVQVSCTCADAPAE